MTAYTIYKAVLERIIPEEKKETYLADAELIRSSLWKQVDSTGLVRQAASSPAFDRPGTSVECQAHFLMMEKIRRIQQIHFQ